MPTNDKDKALREGTEPGAPSNPFVSPPFQCCPLCGRPDTFGVLMVLGNRYFRQCNSCNHRVEIPLPRLRKKVLYLDQFAVSEMARTFAQQEPAKKKADPVWERLVEMIRKLYDLQLLICPSSSAHFLESNLHEDTEFLPKLRSAASHFSGNTEFKPLHWIQLQQIHDHVVRWAKGDEHKQMDFDPTEVTSDNLHGWLDTVSVDVDLGPMPKAWVASLLRSRKVASTSLENVFKGWQERKPTFDDALNAELRGYGRARFEQAIQDFTKRQQLLAGAIPGSPLYLLQSQSEAVVDTVYSALLEADISREEAEPKVEEYLLTADMRTLPFLMLAALIYATVADQVVNGKQPKADSGFETDVQVVSTLLPYCDAMLVDKEVHGLLKQGRLAKHVKELGCRVFSLKARDELMDFLRNLESTASKEHLAKVSDVYGV